MHRLLAALALTLPACIKYEPPPTPQPRDATPVNASMGATWDAVIDLFASRNIPIRTIERASGIIATEALRVDPDDGALWADCGGVKGAIRAGRFHPNWAIYNVLVRGDSTRSTVRATVRWSYIHEKENTTCTSNYSWETELEKDVRSRAESAYRSAAANARDAPPATLEFPRTGSNADTSLSPPAPSAVSPVEQQRSQQGVGGLRTSAQLMQNPSFRQVMHDVQRLQIVSTFEEIRPDTLAVELDDGAFTSASTEHNLNRLYLAYRGLTDFRTQAAMALMHDGRRVGLINPRGLAWEAVR